MRVSSFHKCVTLRDFFIFILSNFFSQASRFKFSILSVWFASFHSMGTFWLSVAVVSH